MEKNISDFLDKINFPVFLEDDEMPFMVKNFLYDSVLGRSEIVINHVNVLGPADEKKISRTLASASLTILNNIYKNNYSEELVEEMMQEELTGNILSKFTRSCSNAI